MKKTKIILIFLSIVSLVFAETLTLEDCFQLAEKNHPIMKQKSPINEIAYHQINNMNTKLLPELNLSLNDSLTKENFLGAINMEKGIYNQDVNFYALYYRQVGLAAFQKRGYSNVASKSESLAIKKNMVPYRV